MCCWLSQSQQAKPVPHVCISEAPCLHAMYGHVALATASVQSAVLCLCVGSVLMHPVL